MTTSLGVHDGNKPSIYLLADKGGTTPAPVEVPSLQDWNPAGGVDEMDRTVARSGKTKAIRAGRGNGKIVAKALFDDSVSAFEALIADSETTVRKAYFRIHDDDVTAQVVWNVTFHRWGGSGSLGKMAPVTIDFYHDSDVVA
jgi:hypothetical protein